MYDYIWFDLVLSSSSLKKVNKVHVNISLALLLNQQQIPQHCLNPQVKRNSASNRLLHSPTESLESKN